MADQTEPVVKSKEDLKMEEWDRQRNEICDSFIKQVDDIKDETFKNMFQTLYDSVASFKTVNLKNKKLLERRKYVTYNELSDAVKNKEPGDIIVYVDDAQKYIVIKTQNQAMDYFITLADYIQGPGIRYQVVFGNEEQKLIFGYYSDEKDWDSKPIVEIIKDLFKVEPTIIYNEHYKCYQIIINKQINNYNEAHLHCANLRKAINNKYPNLAQKCQTILPTENKYVNGEYILNRLGEMGDWKNFCNYLLTYPDSKKFPDAAKIIINISGNNNNVVIGENTTLNIKTDKKLSLNTQTEDWIQQNLPVDGVLTSDYYNAYCKYMNNNKGSSKIVSLKVFTKNIESRGYWRSRYNSVAIWKE